MIALHIILHPTGSCWEGLELTQANVNDPPAVSVCIANYNGAEVIEECLDSVFAQDCDFPFEVIVHDDASTDNSAKIVRDRYPNAIVIPSEKNVGFCISNNRMVAQARGKYILLLNNDAALFPDALRTLHAYAENQPLSGILGLPQYDMNTKGLLDIGSLCDPFLNPVPNLDAGRHDVAMVSGACLWIPRLLWQELGGFPDWFGSLAEDLYLCSLTRLNGYSVQTLGTSGFLHHVGKSFGGGKITKENHLVTSRKRRTLSERNKSFVMALTYPAPLFQLIFPLHLVLLLLEGLLLALIKGDMGLFNDIYFACIKALWLERGRISRLRREAQSKRVIGLRVFLSVFQLVPHKLRMLLRHGMPQIR
jgi:GT2 family glycosyltransferase